MIRDFATPPSLRDRAQAWLDSGEPGPEPRGAATVVLVRSSPSGTPEVFLMHRQQTMAFAAGMVVFPGGGVDSRDGDDLDLRWSGPGPQQWARQLGIPAGAAVELVCAAVRETFEECGVLLATALGTDDYPTVDEGDWESARQRLLAREIALSDLLTERGLVLRSDRLKPWAHWTTPEFEPRRYDTWFFLAELPQRLTARHLGGEASRSEWCTALELLAQHERGEVKLLPPTLVILEELATAPDLRALRAWERNLAEVMPVPTMQDGQLVLRAEVP